jgi:arylsulfatase A-like enzyme
MGDTPNVVFMLGDNVGWGDLSCYGGQVPTPRLDGLAAEGLRLTNFNTEAQCTPTRGALLTGRMPMRTGTYRVPLPGDSGAYGLSPWEYTLAELFSDAGYATACYGKWHLGNVPGRVPTDQGFDEWWGISETSDEAEYTAHPLYPDDFPVPKVKQSVKGGPVEEVADFDLEIRPFMDEQLTGRALDFIRRSHAAEQPFFTYLGFTNVHPPLRAHPDFENSAGSSKALPANIAELDHRAGQVIDLLDELGIADDTIVVWASDNAAGSLLADPMGTSGHWRGAFGGGWEGSMRTPAIIRCPGQVAAGRVSDEMMATYDWYSTLAGLAGLGDSVPSDRPIDGVDMSAFVRGETDESGRESFLYFGTDGEIISAKWKSMKVHFRYVESESWIAPYVKPQIPMVCDLVADPHENIDLMQSDGTLGWVIGVAMRPLVEFQQSTVEFRNLEVGEEGFEGYT